MELTKEKLIETLVLISMLAETLAKQMMIKDGPDKGEEGEAHGNTV